MFFFLVGKRAALTVRADGRELLIVVAAAVVFQVLALLSLNLPSSGVMTTRSLYRQSFLPDLCVSRFGVATTLRLDIAQSLFGLEEPDEEVLLPDPQPGGDGSASTGDGSQSTGGDVSEEQPVVYEPNVMDIDFDTLIANETDQTLLGMHQYFSTREPTLKNEYTGLFEGKNLIFITAEAFWIGAVSEKYTPTLYKLANEGFVFGEFLQPPVVVLHRGRGVRRLHRPDPLQPGQRLLQIHRQARELHVLLHGQYAPRPGLPHHRLPQQRLQVL